MPGRFVVYGVSIKPKGGQQSRTARAAPQKGAGHGFQFFHRAVWNLVLTRTNAAIMGSFPIFFEICRILS